MYAYFYFSTTSNSSSNLYLYTLFMYMFLCFLQELLLFPLVLVSTTAAPPKTTASTFPATGATTSGSELSITSNRYHGYL